jgi:ArsR family transcriptional regulator
MSRGIINIMKAKQPGAYREVRSSYRDDICPGDRHLYLPEIDEDAIAEAAEMHRVLSDETRLKILAFLQADELCVCEIVDALEKPQSTVSHHLFLLQNAGLIKARKQGRWNMYSLDDEVFARYGTFLKLST